MILVAHGTRSTAGVALIAALADRVGVELGRTIRTAFVDVLGPSPREILADTADGGEPAVLVPAFLSRGYHVRTDLPAHIAAGGHPNVTVTPALGPGLPVARVVAARLVDCGWRPGDAVVLAAAGTSDPVASADLRRTATLLETFTGSPVTLGFAATGDPSVAEAVSFQRARGARRVAVASYLLADGLFQRRLRSAGADLVSAPLGTHPVTARLIADRFRAARILPALSA